MSNATPGLSVQGKLWIAVLIGTALYVGSFFYGGDIGTWLARIGATLAVVAAMGLYIHKKGG